MFSNLSITRPKSRFPSSVERCNFIPDLILELPDFSNLTSLWLIALGNRNALVGFYKLLFPISSLCMTTNSKTDIFVLVKKGDRINLYKRNHYGAKWWKFPHSRPNRIVSRGKLKTGQLGSPFGQALRALELTCDDLPSLWSRSNLNVRRRIFCAVFLMATLKWFFCDLRVLVKKPLSHGLATQLKSLRKVNLRLLGLLVSPIGQGVIFSKI